MAKPAAGPKCGAKKKQSAGTCAHPAGLRTDHPGQGRCYLHGGRTPITTGRYSTVERSRYAELVEKHLTNPDPFNLLPELAQLRAHVEDLSERWESIYGVDGALLAWHESFNRDDRAPKPRQMPDFSTLSATIDRVGSMVERIQRLRREQSFSLVTLKRVVEQLGAELVGAATDAGLDADSAARLFEAVEGRWGRVALEPDARGDRGASSGT